MSVCMEHSNSWNLMFGIFSEIDHVPIVIKIDKNNTRSMMTYKLPLSLTMIDPLNWDRLCSLRGMQWHPREIFCKWDNVVQRYTQGKRWGGGGGCCREAPPPIFKFKKHRFVDTVISSNLHDLPFSQKQPLKLAD